ncbi:hypothetical protein EVAR_11793_1 [Eumeta japonica]|uniref:Uncharacterized protein n=1 Tax=Eumeta variegata TaxID=151549 RepID=A0A4C1UPD5_EUMVA|nr:hypothetical protein EVAR_11793_1 [Eumeta japonica]
MTTGVAGAADVGKEVTGEAELDVFGFFPDKRIQARLGGLFGGLPLVSTSISGSEVGLGWSGEVGNEQYTSKSRRRSRCSRSAPRRIPRNNHAARGPGRATLHAPEAVRSAEKGRGAETRVALMHALRISGAMRAHDGRYAGSLHAGGALLETISP